MNKSSLFQKCANFQKLSQDFSEEYKSPSTSSQEKSIVDPEMSMDPNMSSVPDTSKDMSVAPSGWKPTAPKTSLPMIPKNTQNQLNMPMDWAKVPYTKQEPDGWLGKNTQGQLNWFKTKYNLPNKLPSKDLYSLIDSVYRSEFKNQTTLSSERSIPSPIS